MRMEVSALLSAAVLLWQSGVCFWLCVLGNGPQSTFSTHVCSSLTWRADEANEKKEESVTPHRTSLLIRAETILSQRHADLIIIILKHKITACFLLMQLECMGSSSQCSADTEL